MYPFFFRIFIPLSFHFFFSFVLLLLQLSYLSLPHHHYTVLFVPFLCLCDTGFSFIVNNVFILFILRARVCFSPECQFPSSDKDKFSSYICCCCYSSLSLLRPSFSLSLAFDDGILNNVHRWIIFSVLVGFDCPFFLFFLFSSLFLSFFSIR